ncbi:hypothetical protein COCON_G00069690 [Conger conger]|uniref:Protein kinase domain-containing protein n=1 Tax=Conger conger TaxID=82655 RepID=A0A9Q1I4E6_CONCO|nr:hypothetical protein COCON_G00069690 [Conger conger]
MSSSLVSKLAKVYDSKTLQPKQALGKSPPVAEARKPPAAATATPPTPGDGFNVMETRIESLSDKMDKLMDVQATMSAMVSEVNQRSEQQSSKLEGMERLVVGIQQVIAFIGEAVKSSRLMELVCNRPPAVRREAKPAAKEKPAKAAAKERPTKAAAKERPTKATAKERPAKAAAKESPAKQAAKEKTAKEKPTKPAHKEKTTKEKPTKPAQEKPKDAAKEKPGKSPAKITAREKPADSGIEEKPVQAVAQEKPATFDVKGRKTHKRKSLIDLLREHKGKDVKEKARLTFKGLKPQKKKKPPDADTVSLKKQALLLEEVQKLNQQNAERSGRLVTPEPPVATAASGERDPEEDPGARLAFILDGPRAPVAEAEDSEVEEEEEPGETATKEEEEEEEEAQVCSEEQPEEGEEVKADEVPEEEEEEEEEEEAEEEEEEGQETEEIVIEGPTDSEAVGTKELSAAPEDMSSETSPSVQESSEDPEGSGPSEVTAGSSKRRVTEEDLLKEDLKKSRVEEDEEEEQGESAQAEGGEEGEPEKQAEEEEEVSELSPEEYVIDSTPPPLAPFDHRIVAAKPHTISNFYTINREEILGGGRFGQVHKCVENSSGLTLAAKIIKARSQKEKVDILRVSCQDWGLRRGLHEVVRNEIQVMNQLDHANLIQLYAAFESRNDIILVMEYVDGGELFDRIIDENYNLTELDTVLFIRQITEGLQYMHQMYILHLDLKPENILCVSRSTNKIKIIDFGLARRYKPREKLRVNFGTPEFLAPEVINYEFVSFPTDMWSLGVITYMLLSGLSPFLGEDDNETLNNILACQWNFEEDEFSNISEEAKDFITRLLVKSKSWRMSATESLKHPWLSDQKLHYRLHQKGNKCHSTHTPPPES